MLIHVNDAVTLQGARALRQPLIIPYGIHQEYELQIVTGHDNRPVDVESRGCVKWTLTITPSPETPTKVLAYAVFAENIATGSYLRFDFAATSVEMYKHVAGNPATPAVLQLQGFTEEDAPATLVITLPVALVTTAQQRLPVDLSTALMQELQLAVSVVGAAQRSISKYAGDSTDAADRAEQAAINAHASEVNAEHSATAAGISAENARESEMAAETAQSKAELAQGKAEDAQTAAETAQGKAEDAQTAAETAQGKAEDAQDAAEAAQTAAETAQGKAEDAQTAAEAAQTAAETAQGKAEDAQDAAEAAQTAAETAQSKAETAQAKAETAQSKAETAQGKAEDAQTAAETAQGKAEAAQTAAEAAQTAAETAQGKAEDAQTAAETAQTAAETAQGKAEDAQDAAEAAQTAAETAQGKAEDAQTAAETAQGKAEDAQQAAETAQSAAETAQGKAEDAQTAAETAQTAAETAQGKAEDAQDAAEAAQGAAEAALAAAEGSEDAAAASAKLSESWAIGGTGTREGEDENNAKYYAEQSRQFSPENKADKPNPLPEQDGVVAALTTEGNLQSTDVPANSIARQDGYYGAEGLGAHTAEQLIDPNAPATEREFGFDTAAGNITISDNGTGVIDKLMGTTHVANQLVHDTNMNTKSSADGKLVLTDAVGGQLSKLEIHGGCVVHNQLVKDSVEKTVTGTGRLGCDDGVTGNAKSLVMTAPRSVVMNQLVTNGLFNGTTGWSVGRCAISETDGVLTLTPTDASVSQPQMWNADGPMAIVGHAYLMRADAKVDSGVTGSKLDLYINPSAEFTLTDTWTTYSAVRICNAAARYNVYLSGTTHSGNPVYLRNVMLVDLTQYFNGNTTLINSIQTWDDLVAYDPSFASYVQYNTGTVKGVQPTVKVNHTTDVACPVELFGVSNTVGDSFDGVSGVSTSKVGSYTFTSQDAWDYRQRATDGRFGFQLTGKISDALSTAWTNKANLICTAYTSIYVYAGSAVGGPTGIGLSGLDIWVFDDSYTDAASFTAHMAGNTLYYELAEPTTEQYNQTVIPMVDIYNSVLQTAGTRQCPLALTYDGREQTITLDPTHTYVFLDNMTDSSLVTEQSSIDAVGGEDMLVDVTQLYNGDSNKISQIHRWASLSTRFHRYRDLMPYNPGTVEPDTPVVRNYPDEYAYGVIYDPNTSSPACVKVELRNGVVSEVTDFSSMPCHQLYRCVMDNLSTRHIAYYLDDEDSNKKYNGIRNGVTSDGSASVLTGADGDVMVEIPISWWYLDEDYNGTGKVLWLISDRPFMGTHAPAEIHDFFYVSPDGATCRTQYVGAYKASVCDADGNPLNTTEGALAQVTGTASTNKARSIAGALPYVSVNQNDLLARAKMNNGSTVNSKFHQWLFVLMMVEQGSLNTQLISQGYSNGIQNAFCFWRKSGRANFGNGTGQIFADEDSQDMDNFQSLKVGSTTVQRDTLRDADGRYAWSVYNRGATSTRYFTASPTPANGDTVYSESTGDTTAGTVSSYTIKASTARVIQFQYRGIENPFGETWTFEHGIQVYNDAALVSIKVNNVVYTRDPSMDGPASRAFVHEGAYRWVGLTLPSNVHAFLDAGLTQDSGYVASANVYVKYHNGYWETLDTDVYTMTAQQTAANPAYTWRAFPWATAGNGWVKQFDPVTFFAITLGGGATTYLCDYYWTTTSGSRVVCVGGAAGTGSYDGMATRLVVYGLPTAYVNISGRLSA